MTARSIVSAMMRTTVGAILVSAIVVGGCLAPVPPAPSQLASQPTAPTAPTASAASPSGPPVAAASPTPTPVPTDARCEPLAFDPSADLGPEFADEYFMNDQARTIAERFLGGLGSLYAGGTNVDRCDLFTDRGLATALQLDPHLAAADRGEAFVQGPPILRIAFEGTYDLRKRPPVVPIDAIFDLPAGTTIVDPATGAKQVTTDQERIGLNLQFAYDGHRWLVDLVRPIAGENAHWARQIGPVVPGPACTDFVRDPPGSPYDSRRDRDWCDDHGKGRRLRLDSQYALLTKYPCGGHASVLFLGRPLGWEMDPFVRWEYVRDPSGDFARQKWLAAPYDGDARLPKDAVDTGWTNGNVDLWISPSRLDDAVYLVRGDVVEQWGRAAEFWGVIDCN